MRRIFKKVNPTLSVGIKRLAVGEKSSNDRIEMATETKQVNQRIIH